MGPSVAAAGRIEVVQFTPTAFRRAVCEASGCDQISPPAQVQYLESYLRRDLHASVMIIERRYTDRHYIEEFSVYYCKLLHPPDSRATRLHFLDDSEDAELLVEHLCRACGGEHSQVEATVGGAYRGFVVIRPFAHAPIGRTALAHVPEGGGKRDFAPAKMQNAVHLAGFDLRVEGLPFQQQDQGVGACATTALWSMLAATFRHNGQRPPPPAQITSAALVHSHRNRRFPAVDGLTGEQMVAAIDHFGFTPGHFTADDGDELFLLGLLCYLRSGFPVLLHVADNDAEFGHAICAVGYSLATDEEDESIWEWPHGATMSVAGLRFRSVRRVYVHEDRLGPYARCNFLRRVDGARFPSPSLQIAIGGEHESWASSYTSPMRIMYGLVALYPKIRLSARELIDAAVEWGVVAADADLEPLVELRFELGGAYLRRLASSSVLPTDRCVAFVLAAELSRYVGVVSMQDKDGHPFFDVLLDATDIRRECDFAGVLAVVPYSDGITEHFRNLQAAGGLPNRVLIA